MTAKLSAAQEKPSVALMDCGPAEQAAIQRTQARARYLQAAMRELFTPGREYLELGGRWVLTKAGAETLLGCFELVALHAITERCELDENALVSIGAELKARHGYYEARSQCTLQSHTGIVVARASGSANSNETWATGLSVWDAKNPVLKMAEKRALVAAVLVAVGGSAVLTQDLDDLHQAGAAPSGAAAPPAGEVTAPAPAKPAAVPQPTGPRPQPMRPAVSAPQPNQSTWRQPQARTAEGLEAQIKNLAHDLQRRDPKAAELLAREVMTDEQRYKALASALRRAEQVAKGSQAGADKSPVKANTMQSNYKWEDQ